MKKMLLNKKNFLKKHHDLLLALALLAIPVLWWIFVKGYPLAFGLVLGFLDWKSLAVTPSFIGFDNFITFFTSDRYIKSLYNTFYLGGLSFIISTILGCGCALLLNSLKKFQGIFRTIWYIPAITAGVATSQIFNILLQSPEGVINNLIVSGGGEAIYWEFSESWMVFWILVYAIWGNLGGSILLWLAALQSIDRAVLEAGEIDGCNKVQLFFYLSLPQMMPLITFILINGFIGAMNIYEPVMFISNGGPYNATEVLSYRIMRTAFWDNDFGMAGASSIVLMLITVLFSLIVFKRQVKNYKGED